MSRGVLFFCFLFLYSCVGLSDSAGAKRFSCSACCVIKTADYSLREWIEYHKLIGIEHFYLYETSDVVGVKKFLEEYIKKGLVTLVDWSFFSSREGDTTWSLGCEIPAYNHAMTCVADGETQWMVFLDSNEFLVPREGFDLTSLLKKYERYPGIVLKEDFFDVPPQLEPMQTVLIQNTALRKGTDLNVGRRVEKTIVKLGACLGFLWPPLRWSYLDGREPVHVSRREIGVNRYVKKSLQQLLVEGRRGRVNIDSYTSNRDLYSLLDSGYEVEDPEQAIHRFIPLLEERLEARPQVLHNVIKRLECEREGRQLECGENS